MGIILCKLYMKIIAKIGISKKGNNQTMLHIAIWVKLKQYF